MSKSILKSAREAIDRQDYSLTIELCNSAIELEPDNYNAFVFKALALSRTEAWEESEIAFTRAIAINSQLLLAYQGLSNLYQTTKDDIKLIQTLERLQGLLINDPKKHFETCLRLIELYSSNKKYLDEINMLLSFLPSSLKYDVSIDLPSELDIWSRIAILQELHDTETYNQQYNIRKSRISNESMQTIRENLESEIIQKSMLQEALENTIRLSEEFNIEICSKLVKYLFKKIMYSIENKEKIISSLNFYLVKLLNSTQLPMDPDAIFLSFELADKKISDYDLKLVEACLIKYAQEKDIIKFKILLEARDDSSKYFTETVCQEFHLEENQKSILINHIAAYTFLHRTNDYNLATEFGLRALSLQEKMESLLGISFLERKIELNLIVGEAFLKLGGSQIAEALFRFRKVLEVQPDNTTAMKSIAEAMIILNNYEESLDYFKKILSLDPNNQNAFSGMAWVYYLQENYSEALIFIKKAAAIDFDYLCAFRLGCISWKLGGIYVFANPFLDKSESLSNLLLSAKSNPSYSPTFAMLGNYYNQEENGQLRAIKCFQRAIQLDSTNSIATEQLALIFLGEKKNGQAEQLLLNYCNINPRNYWAHKLLGIIFFNAKKYHDAISHLQDAVRINEKDFSAWEILGESFMHEGKYVASLKVMKRAIELASDKTSSFYLLGHIQYKLGEFNDAIKSFSYVLEARPTHIPSLKEKAECYIGLYKESFDQGSFGASTDYITAAARCILNGIYEGRESSILFKILGDIFLNLETLPKNVIIKDMAKKFIFSHIEKTASAFDWIFRQVQITKETDDENHNLLNSALIAYSMATILAFEDQNIQSSFLFDMSISIYRKSLLYPNSNLLEISIKLVRNCIAKVPQSAIFWNGLGVYLSSSESKLSQHCFIKSLQISKSAAAWSNLGYLYLLQSDLEISLQAFSQCQLSDPEFPLCWLGKALIAKSTGSKEYSELLEHSQDIALGTIMEINYLYAEDSLNSKDTDKLQNATFHLLKGEILASENSALLNLLGVCLERIQNYEKANTIFEKALLSKTSNQDTLYKIKVNKARTLCSIGSYMESVNLYSEIHTIQGDAHSYFGLGIANYFNGNVEDTLLNFEIAIQNATENHNQYLLNEILITLGKILYSLDISDNIELAKQQFFSCIASDVRNQKALYGLFSLALISNDDELACSVLQEMAHIDNDSVLKNIDSFYMKSFYAKMKKEYKKCRSLLCQSVHANPSEIERWNRLTLFLARYGNDKKLCLNSSSSTKKLGMVSNLEPKSLEKIYRNHSIALLENGFQSESRCHILKAINISPGNFINWVILAQDIFSDAIYKQQLFEQRPDLSLFNQCVKQAKSLIQNNKSLLENQKWIFHLQNLEYYSKCILEESDNETINGYINELESITINQLDSSRLSLLGALWYRLGNLSKSIYYQKESIIKIQSSSGYETLARYYIENKNLESAIEAYRNAILESESENETALIQLKLAKLYIEMKNYKDSSEMISSANMIFPNECKLLQAVIHKENSNTTKAMKILETIEECKWKSVILSLL